MRESWETIRDCRRWRLTGCGLRGLSMVVLMRALRLVLRTFPSTFTLSYSRLSFKSLVSQSCAKVPGDRHMGEDSLGRTRHAGRHGYSGYYSEWWSAGLSRQKTLLEREENFIFLYFYLWVIAGVSLGLNNS